MKGRSKHHERGFLIILANPYLYSPIRIAANAKTLYTEPKEPIFALTKAKEIAKTHKVITAFL